MVTFPAEGVSSPEIAFKVVVFPDPFGPTIAVMAPGAASKEMPWRTCLPARRTEMSNALIMAAVKVLYSIGPAAGPIGRTALRRRR